MFAENSITISFHYLLTLYFVIKQPKISFARHSIAIIAYFSHFYKVENNFSYKVNLQSLVMYCV
jgi:hypothetical protein